MASENAGTKARADVAEPPLFFKHLRPDQHPFGAWLVLVHRDLPGGEATERRLDRFDERAARFGRGSTRHSAGASRLA